MPGQPFGIRRPHHLRRLGPEGACELFHADFTVRRHHGADRLAVSLGHQRLEHARRLHAEGMRRLQPDARRIRVIVVGMHGEFHAKLFQRLRRPGGFRHGLSVIAGS
jgi:hypothetical protein